jgi:hypothetical protein
MSRSVDARGEVVGQPPVGQPAAPSYPETAGSLLAQSLREASPSEPTHPEERAALQSDI